MSAVSKGEHEQRFVTAELRAERGPSRRIEGYAIVFNSRSVNLGGFEEVIAPSAVNRVMEGGSDLHAFWSHDSSKVLGRRGAGTLQIRKDSRGLSVVIHPPSWADDILESIERGDVTGMSFGFRALDDDWSMDGTTPVRTVKDMVVSEVSVVAKPAYPATDVALRSLDRFLKTTGKDEKYYRMRMAR
jgi:HK97 family phage prohead protease